MLPAIQPNTKQGNEAFYYHDEKLPFSVLTFWQWSSSDLLGNALRGQLAEFIIASALEQLESLRVEWDEYDLMTKKGLKIEIKSGSYLQSWEQKELSKIVFGIQPTGKSQTQGFEKTRKADIYIFCVLTHKDKATVDPLNLAQWHFYILPTAVLNEKVPKQKTLTLSKLQSFQPISVKYDELKHAVETVEKVLTPNIR